MNAQRPPTLADLEVRLNEDRVSLEVQLVGGVLSWAPRYPDLPGDVLAICPPSMFLAPQTAAIMQAIQSALSRGLKIDLTTVGIEIKQQPTSICSIADLGNFAVSYSSGMVSAASVMQSAHTISAEWRKAQARYSLQQAADDLLIFGKPADSAQTVIREAQEVLDAEDRTSKVDLDTRLEEYVSGLDAPERLQKPVRMPWPSLNRILRGGILPGEVVVLAARPSVGKSAFALNVAYSVACSGDGAMIFSLEMPRQQLMDRMVSNIGSVDVGAFREGLTPKQREQARGATVAMRGKPMFVIDDTKITINEIRRRVRIEQRKRGIRLVAVDYLQLLSSDERYASREREVADMSRGLKLLAKELNIAVVILAQLNRKGEEAKREPMLSDLRESGAIEQDADIVIFLHPARQKWNPDEPVKVIIAKGRSSGVGCESLIFRRRFQRFEESNQAEYQQAASEEYAEKNHWTEGGQDELV